MFLAQSSSPIHHLSGGQSMSHYTIVFSSWYILFHFLITVFMYFFSHWGVSLLRAGTASSSLPSYCVTGEQCLAQHRCEINTDRWIDWQTRHCSPATLTKRCITVFIPSNKPISGRLVNNNKNINTTTSKNAYLALSTCQILFWMLSKY